MRWVNVADFKASALTRQTTWPKGRNAALVGDFRKRVGLIHKLRQLRAAEEFAHRSNRWLCVDQIVWHHGGYVNRAHTFFHGALHTEQTDAILVFQQFADRTDTTVAEVIDIVDFALAVFQVHQFLDHGEDILRPQGGERVFNVKLQTHVQLHAANGAEVVAVWIEEQASEQCFCGFARWRLARTHDAVDRIKAHVAVLGLVGLQRVAHPSAGDDMVDVEQLKAVDAGLVECFQVFSGDFVTCFNINPARLFVDQVERRITAKDFFGRDQQMRQAILDRFVRGAWRNLGARREHDFAGLCIHDVEHRFRRTPLFRVEWNFPATGATFKCHAVVEVAQDFFVVQTQRVEQGRDRQLALTVDTDVDDILGIKFKVEPRTTVRNNARGEQIFARRVRFTAVMVKKNARRTVHLRNDNALCTVDEEGAVMRHERHVAHVYVLLLNIEDRTRFGVRVNLKHDEAQCHLHLCGIGNSALTAFFNVIFGIFEFVMDEVEFRRSGKILNRENAAQRFFEAGYITNGRVRAQELLIAFALNLDQVGHVDNFVDVTEDFADTLLTRECRRSGTGCHKVLCLS